MKRRKRIGLLLLIALICGPPLHYLLSPPDDFSLLHQPGIQSKIELPSTLEHASYGWTDDRKPTFLISDKFATNSPAWMSLETFDTQTGVRMSRRQVPTSETVCREISPDGNWVLTSTPPSRRNGKMVPPRKELAATASSKRLLLLQNQQFLGPIVWSPDSTTVVERDPVNFSLLNVFSTKGARARQFNLPLQLQYPRPLFIDRAGNVVVNAWGKTGPECVTLNLANTAKFNRLAVPFPTEVVVLEACLSPDEKAVAWKVGCWRRPSIVTSWLISAFRHSPKLDPPRWFGVFVSRRDGSNLTEIGRVNVPQGSPIWTSPLSSVRWSPRGDRIGFIHNHRFYTLPVKVE